MARHKWTMIEHGVKCEKCGMKALWKRRRSKRKGAAQHEQASCTLYIPKGGKVSEGVILDKTPTCVGHK